MYVNQQQLTHIRDLQASANSLNYGAFHPDQYDQENHVPGDRRRAFSTRQPERPKSAYLPERPKSTYQLERPRSAYQPERPRSVYQLDRPHNVHPGING